MKKEWVRPLTTVQCFEADEYVAACGDENKVYKFKCDAPAGPLYADGEGLLGNSYHPCSATHDAKVSEAFVDGFVDYDNDGTQDDGEAVKVWIEYGYMPFIGKYVVNAHATTNLDMNSWVTAKS